MKIRIRKTNVSISSAEVARRETVHAPASRFHALEFGFLFNVDSSQERPGVARDTRNTTIDLGANGIARHALVHREREVSANEFANIHRNRVSEYCCVVKKYICIITPMLARFLYYI